MIYPTVPAAPFFVLFIPERLLIGANSGDFALAKTCGSSLAANSSCTISVTFTPTASGSRTGTLTISDNAPGSPQTVMLSGRGEDYSLSTDVGSRTVTAGQSATYTLSVTPQGGFNQTVTLACAGAPSKAACSFSQPTVTLNGSSSASVTVSVTTTASTLAPPAPRAPQGKPLPPISGRWPAAVWLGALGWLALLGTAAKGFRRNPALAMGRPRKVLVLPLAALLLAVALWASCGGGGGNVSVTHTLGTPAGSYTLTITGTSGSLTRSTTVTLTVN